MKKSEIKDLYNQSDSALKLLQAMALLLPYCNGEQETAEATQKAAAQAAALWNLVKIMCDYMIDDGSIDMTERLQNIKAEVRKIELSVAKMGYSKERMPLMLNCRAIINQIKDMEAWTTNNTEHQQGHIAAPQQPDNGSSGELTGNGNESETEGENVPPTENFIKITPELQTTDKKAERVFTAAYNEGWITERNDGGYQWKGFGEKSRTRKLAYLCAQIYETPSWKDIESFFLEKQLGRDWGNVKNQIQPDGTGRQTWMNKIDNLIVKALQ